MQSAIVCFIVRGTIVLGGHPTRLQWVGKRHHLTILDTIIITASRTDPKIRPYSQTNFDRKKNKTPSLTVVGISTATEAEARPSLTECARSTLINSSALLSPAPTSAT